MQPLEVVQVNSILVLVLGSYCCYVCCGMLKSYNTTLYGHRGVPAYVTVLTAAIN